MPLLLLALPMAPPSPDVSAPSLSPFVSVAAPSLSVFVSAPSPALSVFSLLPWGPPRRSPHRCCCPGDCIAS